MFSLFGALATALALLPAPSAAQAVRLGESFNASPGLTSIRPDAAYDPANDVYLTISGVPGNVSRVHGRFVSGDGVPLGVPFFLGDFAGYHAMPQASYSADLGGFVVIWQDNRTDPNRAEIWGRAVKFQAGGLPAFVGGDFYVDNAAGGSRSASPPAIVCASGRNECLVVWQQMGETFADIHALRINPQGGALGPELFLTNDNNWQDQPAVAFDPTTGNYMVVCKAFLESARVAQVWAIPVASGTGAVAAVQNLTNMVDTNIPQVALNSVSGQFLITWHTNEGPRDWGRFVSAADGAPVSEPIPVLAGYSGYDAFSLAYNEASGSFFAVTHDNSAEVAGLEISGTGVPGAPFLATALGGRGNYNPTVTASSTRPEWLITVAAGFNFVGAQRVTTTSRRGPGGGGPGRPPSETINLAPGPNLQNGSWFLAEGAGSPGALGYKTYYIISNENPIPVPIRAYFSAEDGYTIKVDPSTNPSFVVPARSRMSVDLLSVAPPGSYGAVFQSLAEPAGYDIQVERSIYWGPNLEGSTGATAVKETSTVWMFAEGSRGGERFANYFLLYNPSQTAADISVKFYLSDGSSVPAAINVGPQSRATIDANSYPALAGRDFATVIQSSGASIVAERAMYWGFNGPNLWLGGTGSVGANSFNSRWYFAEGAAADGYQTYYLLWNPNPTDIWVNARFSTEWAGVKEGRYRVPAFARYTVELNHEVGSVGGSAAEFWSDGAAGILAERSSYWGRGWVEGANVFGTPGTAPEWHLPEGTTGGMFESFLMLLNPNQYEVDVSVTLFFEGKTDGYTFPVKLGPSSRKTLSMQEVISSPQYLNMPEMLGASFATRVRTAGMQAGIVAEHALYWNRVPNDYWRSGSATVGIPTNLTRVP